MVRAARPGGGRGEVDRAGNGVRPCGGVMPASASWTRVLGSARGEESEGTAVAHAARPTRRRGDGEGGDGGPSWLSAVKL